MEDKPEEFKAKMVDGKLQIQGRTEEIPNKNGGIDVIVHAPSLSVISAFNKKLEKEQHEAIGYFRINPAISAGAFTLNQYSALGRHLRKLKYRLGKLPNSLRPELKPSTCGFKNNNCDNCKQKKDCFLSFWLLIDYRR